MTVSTRNTRIAFGIFEADLSSGELWKAGRRVRLQNQPFRVLVALLERSRELVTREELELLVWGPDTTVDFDQSLGTAINKIREALGDSADNPRFVETLARRGYRFIAPITLLAPESQSAISPEEPQSLTAPIAPEQLSPEESESSRTASSDQLAVDLHQEPAITESILTSESLSTDGSIRGPHGQKYRLRMSPMWLAATILVLFAGVALFVLWPVANAVNRFWHPVFASSKPVLICMGLLQVREFELSPNASRSRFGNAYRLCPGQCPQGSGLVALNDSITSANVAAFLKVGKKSFAIRDKDSTSFADLQRGPFVLIGAFSNDWTIRLTDTMRFHFDMAPESDQWWIADRQKSNEKIGLTRTDLPASAIKEDYAIIARVFDPATREVAVVLAGVNKFGTQAAGDFVTDPSYLNEFAKKAPRDWDRKNMELVIETDIVDGEPGPPHVVESFFW